MEARTPQRWSSVVPTTAQWCVLCVTQSTTRLQILPMRPSMLSSGSLTVPMSRTPFAGSATATQEQCNGSQLQNCRAVHAGAQGPL